MATTSPFDALAAVIATYQGNLTTYNNDVAATPPLKTAADTANSALAANTSAIATDINNINTDLDAIAAAATAAKIPVPTPPAASSSTTVGGS
jgi:hypothetical protein